MRPTLASTLVSLLVGLLVTASLALAPGAAHAGSASKKDPNDTQGRLDLARVAVKTQGKKIVGTVTTHDAFTEADLVVPAALGIDFKVGRAGGGDKVRGIAIRSRDGKLVANICTYTEARLEGFACSKVSVKRVSATAVRVVVPRAKVAKGAKTYRWRGGSFAPDGIAGCTTSPFCIDKMVSNPKKWFRLKG